MFKIAKQIAKERQDLFYLFYVFAKEHCITKISFNRTWKVVNTYTRPKYITIVRYCSLSSIRYIHLFIIYQ